MEYSTYTIEDATIADLLGRQNFSNKESAVLELVKNAYDARASKVVVSYYEGVLTIADDGEGMDKSDIDNCWMHVGKSTRGYLLHADDSGSRRIAAGSKGIGRFALARLGEHVKVESKKKMSEGIRWETNWSINKTETCSLEQVGSRMIISELRDRWTNQAFSRLAYYLSITYRDDAMEVELNFEGKKHEVEWCYKEPRMGCNYVSRIDLNYNSEKARLEWNIVNDEFSAAAEQYCSDLSIWGVSGALDILEELVGDSDLDYSENELRAVLTELGDFQAKLFFSLKSATARDAEKFCYKHLSLPNRFEEGVVLYRNAFSISSYEGKKDWLGLGKRARKSPAAATHKTGAWRVRENQLSGMVLIDKKNNYMLRDLSNRQGLEENDHFSIFVKILGFGIAEFERYRQGIVRRVDQKNQKNTERDLPLLKRFIKSPEASRKKFSEGEWNGLSGEIKELIKSRDVAKENEKETSDRYRYETRILNLFATIGLKASSVAHDLRNERNFISEFYNSIVAALKEYGLWDYLSSPELTMYSDKNVPKLLSRINDLDTKLLVFLDAMLSETEKEKFEILTINLPQVLSCLIKRWCDDYPFLEFESKIDGGLAFPLSDDVVTVVFDNLILNSLQQNDAKNMSNKLNISITIKEDENQLHVVYFDNGIGLAKKYRQRPERILEVHETSRDKGHGLGMWMLNNAVQSTGGEVVSISALDSGFGIEFTFGSELK